MRFHPLELAGVGLALGLLLAGPADAQQEEKSADDVAREMSNPVGSLASLTFQGTWTRWGGSAPGVGSQATSSFVFMPTLPFKVWGGNLVVRPSFPLAGLPSLDESLEWEKQRGFGDIVLVANWGKKTDSGLLWSVGATSVFPTAAEGLGKDQFQLGPAAIVGVLKPWGVLGAFWQHWWGLNPAEDEDAVNLGNLQLFYWFSLGGGWQVGGSPVPTADYATASGNTDFSFPVNLGLAKTLMVGRTPIKLTVQGQYFVTRPDVAGSDWGVFFQVTPVVKVPW